MRERGNDIDLLFRKFASDFSERYRVKPITLTEEAKSSLLKYSFPGNIRQLKNIVEQISVLSTEDKLVSAEKLLKYLPGQSSSLPAIYKNADKESLSERDLLYKVLFDMKKDMNELKKFVLEVMKDESAKKDIMADHSSLFENIDQATHDMASPEEPVLLDITSPARPSDYIDEEEDVQDIAHEMEEEESLSLEKKEKELIIKALSKNNNKRKYAANDLGISERTLYRKIKQYELEE